jgi:hypothetical protein
LSEILAHFYRNPQIFAKFILLCKDNQEIDLDALEAFTHSTFLENLNSSNFYD